MARGAEITHARILLVEAPVGYGKTTFAERVVAARDAVVIRLRVGPGPDALVSGLVRGLRRSGLVDVADAVASAEPADALDHFVAALTTREDAAQLVVDDAHLLEPDAATALADLVADLPASCAAIVCGRDLAAFRSIAARPDAAVVRADDLRLTASDIATLLDTTPDDSTVLELIDATEGWPAAVDLAVARVRRDPHWSAAQASGVRALLRDLVEELARTDPRLPTIARLPLFDDVTISIIAPGDDRPLDVPARLIGRWRVVPAAIRDLFDEAALPDGVAVAVAEHYHSAGETPAALTLLRREDPGALLPFAAGMGWDELADLDVTELRELVDELGEPATDDHVQLLVNAAKAAELSDRPLRARWLQRAQAATVGTPAATRAVEAEVARDVLRAGEVDRGAELARAVLESTTTDEPATRARALVTIGMRDAYLCTPESLADAARTFTEAVTLYRRAGETQLQAETLARLGYTALYIAGYPAEGAQAMSEAIALLPVGDRLRAFWLTMYADVLNVLGRIDESDAAVREAIDIGARRRDPTTSGMAWWTKSWSAALRGDAEGLRAALGQVERHRGAWMQGGQEAEYLGSSAEHLSLVGDLAGYREYFERAQRMAAEIDYPEVVTTPRAYFEAEHGDAATALQLLDELEHLPGVAPGNAPRRLLLRAIALLRTGEPDAARRALDQAHEQARAMGVPDLLQRMHHKQLTVVADLLNAPEPPTAEPHLQLLGRFALTVGADDRTPQPGHPANLVKVLALRGSMTSEAAIDQLWPEVDVATGRSRLRNMLNRLKERSGAIVVRNGDVLRLDDSVRVDAAAFEQAAATALAAPPDERVGRARHALALYTGDLLPGDVYEEFTAADRARLQRRYVSLADLVASDSIDRGDLDEAARLLDLGITVEPLDEARPLLLCRLLAEQGRSGAARQVAQRCVAALRELDAEPSRSLLRYATPG